MRKPGRQREDPDQEALTEQLIQWQAPARGGSEAGPSEGGRSGPELEQKRRPRMRCAGEDVTVGPLKGREGIKRKFCPAHVPLAPSCPSQLEWNPCAPVHGRRVSPADEDSGHRPLCHQLSPPSPTISLCINISVTPLISTQLSTPSSRLPSGEEDEPGLGAEQGGSTKRRSRLWKCHSFSFHLRKSPETLSLSESSLKDSEIYSTSTTIFTCKFGKYFRNTFLGKLHYSSVRFKKKIRYFWFWFYI